MSPYLFRPQRGSLNSAMRECVEVVDHAALEAHLGQPVSVALYSGPDERIGWPVTNIVTDAHGSPLGFTTLPPRP